MPICPRHLSSMKNLIDLISSGSKFVQPLIAMFGDKVHEPVQRALTIPKRDFEPLLSGMSEADKAEAYRLRDKAADANADLIIFVASRGQIEAD